MRVAYLCLDPGIPLSGAKGAANHVREFCAALQGAGHDVALFGARMGDGGDPPPCSTRIVGLPSTAQGADRERQELGRNTALRRMLTEAHRRRPFDLVYERYSLWSHAACALARGWSVPYVLEVNSPLKAEQVEYRALHRRATAAAIETRLFTAADVVVAVSDAVADYAKSIRGTRKGVVVVPNGVDLRLFAAPRRRREPGARETFVLGFVGSLKPWHGLDVLVTVFAQLAAEEPAYRLLVVGAGPERGVLEQAATAFGLEDRIELTGAVAKHQIPQLLDRMDVALAPYPRLADFYFSPLKLFEYMAAGIPLVASRIGQLSAVIESGRTGVLVEPGDPAALAASIRLLRSDPERCRRLGRQARATAVSEHGWPHRIDMILDALRAQRQPAAAIGTVA